MNILVLGGSYFLGKHFVEMAHKEHTLTVFNRGSHPLDMEDVTELVGDRQVPAALSGLDGLSFDAVVDFCAYEKGDIAMVCEALKGQIGQYVLISTCDVYERGLGRLLDETTPFEALDFQGENGAYIRGKVALEQELVACGDRYGFVTTSLRPAILYGPDNYAPRENVYFNWICQAGQILQPKDATGEFQMVYVEDAVKAIMATLGNEKAYNRAYNLAGAIDTYDTLGDALEQVVAQPFEKVTLSVKEITQQKISLPFPLTLEESNRYDGKAALELIGAYTPLAEGMWVSAYAYGLPVSAAKGMDFDGSGERENSRSGGQNTRHRNGQSGGNSQLGRNSQQGRNYQAYVDEIERLFEENRAKDAEAFMQQALQEAKAEGDEFFALQMLNELIGYYRQTSEKEQLLQVMQDALAVAENLGLPQTKEGKIPYATTVLNVANGYRSIGDLNHSEQYYRVVQDIYKECLDQNDMLVAGLYNNMSLLYQEHRDYEKAMSYQLQALEIVKANGAGFELAVTYANLANTAVLAANCGNPEMFSKAEEYAREGIRVFEERNTFDAHYCAALSALGMCAFHREEYRKAYDLFDRGMRIVEKTLGKNSQYMRLKENRDKCEPHIMNGMKLSQKYYEEVGKPALQARFPQDAFPNLMNRLAIGLVGEGSDCFGYDDDTSADHDWGPDFCIFVPDDLYEKPLSDDKGDRDSSIESRTGSLTVGQALEELYESLPKEFMGYERSTTKTGSGRRGVIPFCAFAEKYLGVAMQKKNGVRATGANEGAEGSEIDRIYETIHWKQIPDYSLAAAVNGQIFEDYSGEFSALRTRLRQGYPEHILYLKLAEDVATFSQTGQYNYDRMLGRGDRITADMMLFQCIRQIMILAHHLENVYPPHDKWLRKSFENLCCGTPLPMYVRQLHESLKMEDDVTRDFVAGKMNQVGEYFAKIMYDRNLISDVESYLDYHTDELLKKATFSRWSKEELVERIVVLEEQEMQVLIENINKGLQKAIIKEDEKHSEYNRSKLRRERFSTWNRTMLMQYLYDFVREQEQGHNLIEEKYGRMTEYTDPETYHELVQKYPLLSEQKRMVAEQIASVENSLPERFVSLPEGLPELQSELSTYSDKMLQLYGQYVVAMAH